MKQSKSFLVSLVSEHLLAKFFALVFASITVFLIEREITTQVPFFEGRVSIGLRPAERPEGDTPFILIQADPKVWFAPPSTSPKVSIQGPKNLRAAFLGNPIIRLRIREEGVRNFPAGKPDILPVDESMFESDIKGLEVRLTEPLSLDVDLIRVQTEVPIRVLPPTNLPPSRAFDPEASRVTPERIALRGPRWVVEGLGDRLPVDMMVDPGGRTGVLQDGVEYGLKLRDDLVQRGVALSGNVDPRLVLALKVPTYESIRLVDLPIHWSFTEEVRRALAKGELEILLDNEFVKEADVEIKGPPDLVKPYQNAEKRQELRGQLYVIADPNQDIGALDKPDKVISIRLRAIGVPTGLEATTDPVTLTMTLHRKESENH
ncbi:MAG: hypothetical protein H6807_12990 [Planctomycetes bacterium]|nr:hypothetical protein [Planctomycetota bacterium]